MIPITLPVTDGLGENAAGALNALVPVPALGSGWRPCARGLLIHTSLFPYSRVVGSRASDNSHDALSVFEATVVEDRAYNWGASSQRPRLSYGCSCYVHQLGYPLLISSTHIISVNDLDFRSSTLPTSLGLEQILIHNSQA